MKTIIFDMDGVIFDSEQLVLKNWMSLADKYHLKNVEEVYRKCIGTTREATRAIFIENVGQDFPYDEFREDTAELFHTYRKNFGMPMKPGVYEILDCLRGNSYKVGLATSTRQEVVMDELEQANILQYFDQVVCGDMLKRSKPEPDIYLMACEKMNVKPAEAYAIEDSYNGIRASFSAGMKPIMIPDMIEPDQEMREKAFRIFTSLSEMQLFLQKGHK
ncbi:MAG: HAD family phosphatase [Lachnospiraceae bacterium]|nr:HAD family phosphatase [Lachnospiraceae bacterium]